MTHRVGEIRNSFARPNIGQEYLAVEQTGHGRWKIRRLKKVTLYRDEDRQLKGLDDIASYVLISQLLDVMEGVTDEMGIRGGYRDLDHTGIDGSSPSIRSRFERLVSLPRVDG